MSTTKFITSAEVAEELGVSVSKAYKVVRKLNDELEEKGFMVVSGRVSRRFFAPQGTFSCLTAIHLEEKFYGLEVV